jgi:hypothetical protein
MDLSSFLSKEHAQLLDWLNPFMVFGGSKNMQHSDSKLISNVHLPTEFGWLIEDPSKIINSAWGGHSTR